MSFFIFISVPIRSDAKGYLPDNIQSLDISNAPIGKAVGGTRKKTYAILHGGCSTDLLDRGHRSSHLSKIFTNSLERMLFDFPFVPFAVHFCRERLDKEKIFLKRRLNVDYQDFQRIFPSDVEEDVRYNIFYGRINISIEAC